MLTNKLVVDSRCWVPEKRFALSSISEETGEITKKSRISGLIFDLFAGKQFTIDKNYSERLKGSNFTEEIQLWNKRSHFDQKGTKRRHIQSQYT